VPAVGGGGPPAALISMTPVDGESGLLAGRGLSCDTDLRTRAGPVLGRLRPLRA